MKLDIEVGVVSSVAKACFLQMFAYKLIGEIFLGIALLKFILFVCLLMFVGFRFLITILSSRTDLSF